MNQSLTINYRLPQNNPVFKEYAAAYQYVYTAEDAAVRKGRRP